MGEKLGAPQKVGKGGGPPKTPSRKRKPCRERPRKEKLQEENGAPSNLDPLKTQGTNPGGPPKKNSLGPPKKI